MSSAIAMGKTGKRKSRLISLRSMVFCGVLLALAWRTRPDPRSAITFNNKLLSLRWWRRRQRIRVRLSAQRQTEQKLCKWELIWGERCLPGCWCSPSVVLARPPDASRPLPQPPPTHPLAAAAAGRKWGAAANILWPPQRTRRQMEINHSPEFNFANVNWRVRISGERWSTSKAFCCLCCWMKKYAAAGNQLRRAAP